MLFGSESVAIQLQHASLAMSHPSPKAMSSLLPFVHIPQGHASQGIVVAAHTVSNRLNVGLHEDTVLVGQESHLTSTCATGLLMCMLFCARAFLCPLFLHPCHSVRFSSLPACFQYLNLTQFLPLGADSHVSLSKNQCHPEDVLPLNLAALSRWSSLLHDFHTAPPWLMLPWHDDSPPSCVGLPHVPL